MRILSNVLSGDNMLCYREGEFSHGANVGFCSSTTYSDFAIYSGVKLTNAHVNSYDSTPCFILRTTEYVLYISFCEGMQLWTFSQPEADC